jgi:hypothetical protein
MEAGRLGSERGRWRLPGLLRGRSKGERAELCAAAGRVFAHRDSSVGPRVEGSGDYSPLEGKRALVWNPSRPTPALGRPYKLQLVSRMLSKVCELPVHEVDCRRALICGEPRPATVSGKARCNHVWRSEADRRSFRRLFLRRVPGSRGCIVSKERLGAAGNEADFLD